MLLVIDGFTPLKNSKFKTFFEEELFYNFAAKSLLTLTPSFCFLSKTILMQSHQLILF